MKSLQDTHIFRCISAEILKTRRTIYLLGVIVMPSILSLLNFLLMLGTSREHEYATQGGWLSFSHNTISFWSMLVLPCVIVLVSAFSAHQEHDTKRWRILMCLPLPKSAIYLGKLAVIGGLTLLSCVLLWVENICWGWLLSILRPETGLSLMRLNLFGLLLPFVLIFLFSLILISIHFWFSMRVQNFVLTVGIGFFLSLVGAFLHDEAIWRVVFPWCLPSLVRSANSLQEGMAGLLYSLSGFALLAYLGSRNFQQHDVLF
jgi:hypothetical protein